MALFMFFGRRLSGVWFYILCPLVITPPGLPWCGSLLAYVGKRYVPLGLWHVPLGLWGATRYFHVRTPRYMGCNICRTSLHLQLL